MRTPVSRRTGNRLLDCLPPEEVHRIAMSLDLVSFGQAEEIYRQNGPLSHVYFPRSGIYATFVGLEDGRVVEASTVGNEGMIGLAALLGLDFSFKTATTPVPGQCWRLPVGVFHQTLVPGSAFDRVLRRYAAFALRNAYQTVACNASHSTQERMCRWLLTNQDRVGRDHLLMTHESLAHLLGVRRQTVTVVLGKLEAGRYVTSRRGVVRILNRRRLESRCCECYHVGRSLYEQIVHCPDSLPN